MRTFKLKFILFCLGLSLTACAKQEEPRARVLNGYLISNSTSVIDHYPGVNETNVPTLSNNGNQVVVKFSAPIRTSSVDYFTFQVVDELGIPLEGFIHFNRAQDEIIFTRETSRRLTALDTATTYTVITQFIRDRGNQLIAPYSFEFRTVDFTEKTGKFRILKVTPDDAVIIAGSPIEIVFSEPVHPNTETCDNPAWADAFQVLQLDSLNETDDAEFFPIDGRVCLKCDKFNRCDRLQFRPTNSVQADYMYISIRDTEGLRGISGERLDGEYEEFKFVLNLGSVF